MRDLLREGMEWLEMQRTKYMSGPAVYKTDRGAGIETFDVQATFGKTDYEIADGYGATIKTRVIDFLISAEDLTFEPEAGDVILADNRKYEVMNLGGESCWRWSDPYRITLRIHTKDIGDEDA
jgi:hypothetical protein